MKNVQCLGEYFSEACGRKIGLDLPPADADSRISGYDDTLPNPLPGDLASQLGTL